MNKNKKSTKSYYLCAMEKKKVLVGMSGGVDSSVVCMLLIEQGYDVVGVTMRMWDAKRSFAKYSQELPDYIIDAKNLADKLSFPHYVLDLRQEFQQEIVDYFAHEYLSGRTPNPCVKCNQVFKWPKLQQLADELGCQYIATGHYANIKIVDGNCYIARGEDSLKDQSYFLWNVETSIWKRTLFPLGSMKKEEIKSLAASKGFVSLSTQKESMEICFVEDDYRDFLRKYYPTEVASIEPGHFVDPAGLKLGMHEGYPFYTVGQRKGLRIALGEPAYVLKINPAKNTVMLGNKQQLESTEMVVEQYRIVNPEDFKNHVKTQIRYRSKGIDSMITIVNEEFLLIQFDEPVSAITSGQSAAFYDGDRLLGGGIIAGEKALKKAKKLLRGLL